MKCFQENPTQYVDYYANVMQEMQIMMIMMVVVILTILMVVKVVEMIQKPPHILQKKLFCLVNKNCS